LISSIEQFIKKLKSYSHWLHAPWCSRKYWICYSNLRKCIHQ